MGVAQKPPNKTIDKGAANISSIGTVYIACTLIFLIMVSMMISVDPTTQGPPGLIASIFKLLFMLIMGALLIGYILVKYGSKMVGKYYNNIKCSPIIMPFVGMMGKDATENVQDCFWLYLKAQVDIMLMPIFAMNAILIDIMKTLSQQMGSLQVLFAPFRFMIDIALRQFYFQMSKSMTTIAFLQAKSKSLLSRLAASYNISQKTLELSNYTVKGFANSKIMSINKDWAKVKDFFEGNLK